MGLTIGFLFWLIVVVSVIIWVVDYRRRVAGAPYSYFGLVMIALVLLLGISEFGGLHLIR